MVTHSCEAIRNSKIEVVRLDCSNFNRNSGLEVVIELDLSFSIALVLATY